MNAYQNFKDTAAVIPFDKLVALLDSCHRVNNCLVCWDWDNCLEWFDQRAEYIDTICRHCERKVANYYLCPACGGKLENKKGGENGR